MKERKIMIINKKDFKRSLMPYIFLLVFIIGCLIAFNLFNTKVHELSYNEFMKNLNGGKIIELTGTPKVRTETYKLEGKLEEYSDGESLNTCFRRRRSKGVGKRQGISCCCG